MSAEHCGHMQDTPYCAYCGRKLWDNTLGLGGLLRHVEGYTKSLAASLEELPSGDLSDKKEKLLAKWESWQEALKKVVDDTSK